MNINAFQNIVDRGGVRGGGVQLFPLSGADTGGGGFYPSSTP